jgi:hypothetical protein
MASKRKSLITPKGVAHFPWVNKPDTKFGKEEFKCGLVFASVEVAKPVIDAAKALGAEAFGPKTKVKLPLEKQEDGTVLLRAKSKEKPTITDSKGNTIKRTVKLGGGSIIKLGITLSSYDKTGKGVTAYLDGVQVLKLVEFGGNKPNFGDASDEIEDDDAFVAGADVEEDGGDEGAEDGEELSSSSDGEDASEF